MIRQWVPQGDRIGKFYKETLVYTSLFVYDEKCLLLSYQEKEWKQFACKVIAEPG